MRRQLIVLACFAALAGCTTADEQLFANAATAVMTGYAAGSGYRPTYQTGYVAAPPRRTVPAPSYSGSADNGYCSKEYYMGRPVWCGNAAQ
jgi:hypothetical protein